MQSQWYRQYEYGPHDQESRGPAGPASLGLLPPDGRQRVQRHQRAGIQAVRGIQDSLDHSTRRRRPHSCSGLTRSISRVIFPAPCRGALSDTQTLVSAESRRIGIKVSTFPKSREQPELPGTLAPPSTDGASRT